MAVLPAIRHTQAREMKDAWTILGGLIIGIQLAVPTKASSQKYILE